MDGRPSLRPGTRLSAPTNPKSESTPPLPPPAAAARFGGGGGDGERRNGSDRGGGGAGDSSAGPPAPSRRDVGGRAASVDPASRGAAGYGGIGAVRRTASPVPEPGRWDLLEPRRGRGGRRTRGGDDGGPTTAAGPAPSRWDALRSADGGPRVTSRGARPRKESGGAEMAPRPGGGVPSRWDAVREMTTAPRTVPRERNPVRPGRREGEPSEPSELERVCDAVGNTPLGSLGRNEHPRLVDVIGGVMASWFDFEGWTEREAQLAERLLFRMEEEEEEALSPSSRDSEEPPALLTLMHYVNVMNAYAKSPGSPTIGRRAEAILDHVDRRSEGRPDLRPNRMALNTVIGAHAKSTHPNSAKDAERLLGRLERAFDAGDKDMKPSARSYSKVIDAWARTKGRGSAERAYMVLLRMETEFQDGNRELKPNALCYTNVMDAFAKSQEIGAVQRAEEVLYAMLALYDEKGERYVKPDNTAFSVVIDAWAKSRRNDAGQRALKIFDLMREYQVEADIYTYNVVINALANSVGDEGALIEAERILNAVERHPVIMADAFTYNAMLKAYAKNAHNEGGERAERFLQHWEMEYKRGRTHHEPDCYSYVAVMNAWKVSNGRGSALKANQILDFMEENNIRTNTFCYNSVIEAWSRCFECGAATKADSVFHRLLDKYKRSGDKDTRPDSFSYCGVIRAWARSTEDGAPEMAERYLHEMIENKDIENPDPKCFSAVIGSWSACAASGKGTIDPGSRAEHLVDVMLSIGVKPDTVCFNSVITVLAKSHLDNKGSRAMNVLRRMHKMGIAPNSVTYTVLIEACQCQPPVDAKYLEDIFEDCIENGMLDGKIVQKFLDMGPASVCEKIDLNSVGHLPPGWTRNANRGPASLSKNQIRWQRRRNAGTKKREPGMEPRRWAW